MVTTARLNEWIAQDQKEFDAFMSSIDPAIVEDARLHNIQLANSRAAEDDEEQDQLFIEEDALDWTEEEERSWAQQDRIDLFRNEY